MKSQKLKPKSNPAPKPKKAKPKVAEFTLTVVGLKYRMDKIEMSQLSKLVDDEEGVPCQFQREPDNEVDPKAVKVIVQSKYVNFSNRFIGYVRRPSNATLSELLRQGAEVKLALLTYVDANDGEGELEVAVFQPR
jgi:hypothetical protein